jgi:hypothetical protein
MKKHRKKITFIFSFLAFILSNSTDVHSAGLRHDSIEIQSDANNYETNINTVADPVDKDQIDQSTNSGSNEKSISQIMIPSGNSIVYTFNISIWRPPEVF